MQHAKSKTCVQSWNLYSIYLWDELIIHSPAMICYCSIPTLNKNSRPTIFHHVSAILRGSLIILMSKTKSWNWLQCVIYFFMLKHCPSLTKKYTMTFSLSTFHPLLHTKNLYFPQPKTFVKPVSKASLTFYNPCVVVTTLCNVIAAAGDQ